MSRTRKRSYAKDLAKVMADLINQHEGEDLEAKDLFEMVLESNRIEREILNGIREQAVLKWFTEVLRSEHFVAENGEKIRRFHSLRRFVQTDDGKEKQLCIWKTIETMDAGEMYTSCRSRLRQSEDIVARVKADVRYWETHVAPKIGAETISKQLGLDLND